jgi:hypothetical protein
MLSTDVFYMKSYDGSSTPNLIATGPIDIIRMTEFSTFNVLQIDIENPINGAESDYTITF